MKLHEIYPGAAGKKKTKRRGRGPGSGLGCTAGRGNKGQNARAGGGTRPGFEGGQMPLVRRLPKRGFTNAGFRIKYSIVNLETLNQHFQDREEVSLEDLYQFCPRGRPVKVLGRGGLERKMKVTAHAFSKSAAEKIVQAGGRANSLEG
ncbi:MAG: 50S ribosomal protein L15 [Desulfohalobiaceae bacterium]|nr:50S ribosomal protein L15 [Desulfohalobiaceae bacterium]